MIFTDLLEALEEADYMSEFTGKPYYLVGEKDGGCRVTDQAKPGEYLEKISPEFKTQEKSQLDESKDEDL